MIAILTLESSALRLDHPFGLAIDRRGTGQPEWIYIADSFNNRIVKLPATGRVLSVWH
jgi:hypothetical protein